MPRFLRLQNTVIHVPSVSDVSMGTSCLGKPYLSVSYHTAKKQDTLYYKTWSDCETAFNSVKAAVKEIDTLLSSVPLTTPDSSQKVTVEMGVQTDDVIIQSPPQPIAENTS
jgi:hypothetical protein